MLVMDKNCKVNHSDSFHIHLFHFRVSRTELAACIYRERERVCVCHNILDIQVSPVSGPAR
jgi:hypothetical protein